MKQNAEEMLGTKLRALYQRKKGRDLFDLFHALTNLDLDTSALIKCYKEYMAFSVDRLPTKCRFYRVYIKLFFRLERNSSGIYICNRKRLFKRRFYVIWAFVNQ